MAKALVILAHPHMERSRFNRRWVERLEETGLVTVHCIADCGNGMTPEMVRREQALIEEHDAVILQFPLYDFYMPAVGKVWLDEVFCWGWAFGPTDAPECNHMRGLKLAAACSCGCSREDLSADGSIGHTLDECLSGLPSFARYGKARWMGLHRLYGAESHVSDETLEQNCDEYVEFVKSVLEG